MSKHKLMLFSGKLVDVFNLTHDDIDIHDIAHALAFKSHWNGHAKVFYSIAQHSIDVCNLCSEDGPECQLFGLLHDAAEAYLFDAPRPIKQSVYFFEPSSGYNMSESVSMADMEQRILSRIWARFGLPPEEPKIVKVFDDVSVISEWVELMPHNGWNPWPNIIPTPRKLCPMSPEEAEEDFLSWFFLLMRRLGRQEKDV